MKTLQFLFTLLSVALSAGLSLPIICAILGLALLVASCWHTVRYWLKVQYLRLLLELCRSEARG